MMGDNKANFCIPEDDREQYIAAVAMSAVRSKFFVNESVCVLPSRQAGKIVRCSRDVYRIALADGSEAEELFGNIQRRHAVFY